MFPYTRILRDTGREKICFPGISFIPNPFAYRNPTGAQRCLSKQKMLCPCLGRTEGATSCLSLASQGRQWGSAPRLFLSPCSDQQNPTRAPRPSSHGANPSLFRNHSLWCARPCRSNEHSVLWWPRARLSRQWTRCPPSLLSQQCPAPRTATEQHSTPLRSKWILTLMWLAYSVPSKYPTRFWWGRESNELKG